MTNALKTVLVVEDDSFTRRFIRNGLEEAGYLVLEASAGHRSLDILQQYPIDAIILDLYLPDGDGLDFLRFAREYSNAPVLIVSGETCENTRIQGFELGADDYIIKPILMTELLARLNAHIRRDQLRQTQKQQTHRPFSDCHHVCFGDWMLDREQFQIFNTNNESGQLTAQEFHLLCFLISNSGRVITRGELCDAARDKNYTPSPRAIDVKITRIRQKLQDDATNPQIIKTIRGIGYLFNQDCLSLPSE